MLGIPVHEKIPLEIQVLNRRAIEMSSHDNYAEARKLFSSVVFIAPGFARAHFEMGRCLENPGRYNEAVERFEKAKRLDQYS